MSDLTPDRGGDQSSVLGCLQCAGGGQRAAAGRVPHHAGGADRHRLPGQRDCGDPFRNGGGGRADQAVHREEFHHRPGSGCLHGTVQRPGRAIQNRQGQAGEAPGGKGPAGNQGRGHRWLMFELAEYGEPLTEFDDRLWLTVIDTMTVHRDGRLAFRFQTGHEITV